MSNKYQPKTILHHLLDKQQMSQKYFSELLQTDAPCVSLYLSGKRLPSADLIKTMAELLQVDNDYLTGIVVALNLKRQYTKAVRNLIADQLKKDIEQDFVTNAEKEL